MASIYILSLILCAALVNVEGTDLYLGQNLNTQLIYTETVKMSSIPLTKRITNVYYNNPVTPIPIKAINCIDLLKGKAEATIVSGGLGSPFANIRFKSEKGKGLHYQVQIFG